jgi:hypothetical protein
MLNHEVLPVGINGLANRRLQPLGHLSTSPSETPPTPGTQANFHRVANFQLSTYDL